MNDDPLIHGPDSSGWARPRTIDAGTKMNGHLIRMEMESVARCFPGKPVRAVDQDGRIYDMLP